MTEGAKVSIYVWSVAAGDWVPMEVAVAGLMPVTIDNWPATYPLSVAQIALLRAVTVGNFPADPSTGGRQDVQTDVMSLIRILLTARLPAILSVNTATTGKVAVGNVSTAVLAVNATRIFAQFVNDSDEEIYLDLSALAVMNEGIRLNANGGSFEINQTNLYTGAITAICATGGKNLTVTEG